MDIRSNRWIAGISLLALFAIIAVAGGKAVPGGTTQPVLVTNTSAQPIPIADHPASGAYVVSVANTPSVNVNSSSAAPVITKDSNNPDSTLAMVHGTYTLAANNSVFVTPNITLSPTLPAVVDSVSLVSASNAPAEYIDNGAVGVRDSANKTIGDISFLLPVDPQDNHTSDYLGAARMPVPAGDTIVLVAQRDAGLTGSCYLDYTIMYHTIQNP